MLILLVYGIIKVFGILPEETCDSYDHDGGADCFAASGSLQ